MFTKVFLAVITLLSQSAIADTSICSSIENEIHRYQVVTERNTSAANMDLELAKKFNAEYRARYSSKFLFNLYRKIPNKMDRKNIGLIFGEVKIDNRYDFVFKVNEDFYSELKQQKDISGLKSTYTKLYGSIREMQRQSEGRLNVVMNTGFEKLAEVMTAKEFQQLKDDYGQAIELSHRISWRPVWMNVISTTAGKLVEFKIENCK